MSDLKPAQRWRLALGAARSAGVHVRTNVKVCCHSCTTHADLGMALEEIDVTPYAYFLSTQGRRVRFTKAGDVSPLTEHDVCYFTWGNGSAPALVKAFRDQGFDVEWDGSDHRTVAVRLRGEKS